MADQSPLADQAALDTLQKLLAQIDATENIELADKVLQLVFSNNTASKNFSVNTQAGEGSRTTNAPEWYQKQKAEENIDTDFDPEKHADPFSLNIELKARMSDSLTTSKVYRMIKKNIPAPPNAIIKNREHDVSKNFLRWPV